MLSVFCWCEKRDLNPYSVNYTPLKRARLPVPPLSLATLTIIHHLMAFVKGFSKKSEKYSDTAANT